MPLKEKPVNTPVTKELRKLIKMKAAAEGVSMLDYVERLLKEHWKNEGSTSDDKKSSND